MSGAMLKQMMEEASAFLKEEKYDKALDAARRVSQFSASNFPALMCVGVASFHLKLWEDAETALRRAADLKPELPAPWKNLVDLYDATGDAAKKIEVLEKLVGVFRSGNKVKPSQKWVAELATTAMSVKQYGKAFDAWYMLVDEKQGLSVEQESNDELPSSLAIWLNLVDLIQHPAFSLSDAKASNVSMDTLLDQFVATARGWDWADRSTGTESLRVKTDVALAMFLRHQLDQVKKAKAGKTKQVELKKLDALTASVIEWFPSSKTTAEYLLLRSEDEDAPVSNDKVIMIAAHLQESFAKSPMSLMFQGFSALNSDSSKGRELLVEGLASCSASSFHESSLCIRAQMELASAALLSRDVEGCLARLQKAQEAVAEKASTFGCGPPKSSVYSEIKIQLLQAQAHNLSGAFDAAIEAYKSVITTSRSSDDANALAAATVGAGDLLCSRNRPTEALEMINRAIEEADPAAIYLASLQCSKAWAMYLLNDLQAAKTLLQENHSQLSSTAERARSLKRLAIVYWYLCEPFRTDKQACFGTLLQAAKLAPSDGEVFAWLGKWYKDIAKDAVRAEKCFLKALSLAPLNEMAGLALSEVYEQQNKTDLNVKLWQDLTTAPESAPTWALLRLAQFLVDQDDEEAVTKLHLVLRNDPLNAKHWVAMGHVYRHFGKLVAAQRSYLRSIELGESGWCVLTELARIEGTLHLFEDAIERIRQASDDTDDVPRNVIATVHAELLFEQAKFFNGEGLYGRAAANIKNAAAVLQPVAVSGCAIPILKLLGDIHSFGFYLSPLDFGEGGWFEFLAQGRKAYEQVASSLSADSAEALAQAHYDVGVSCWYQARALYSMRGKRFNAFALHTDAVDIKEAAEYFDDARKHLRQALQYEPSFSLAWNALGVVLKHPLAKQLAWTRAIQSVNFDAAWANLGMLYLHHRSDASRTADLARNAFLHLQAVNTNNPAMWIGYGMIYLSQNNKSDHRKAREAFLCALEMGNHLDALQGVVLSTVISYCDTAAQDEVEMPSLEFLHFAIKKYLERESADPLAWSLMSSVQFQLGLLRQASESTDKSVELSNGETHGHLTLNNTIIGAAKRVSDGGDSTSTLEALSKALFGKSAIRQAVEAQRLYSSSDRIGALKAARIALEMTASASSEEHGRTACFALALCALTVSTHRVEATSLAEIALAVLSDRMTSGSLSMLEVEAAEAYHRAAGTLDAFVSVFSTENKSSATDAGSGVSTNVRRKLALVDLADAAAFTTRIKDVTIVGDALHLVTLKSLLASDAALAAGEASSPLKLVRAEPWNPTAYAYAALRVLKTAVLDDSTTKTTALSSALRLLDTGLRVADDQSEQHVSASVLLHWTSALVHQRIDPKNSKVKVHVDKALELLHTSVNYSVVDKLQWEARIMAIVDHSVAIEKYSEALRAANSTSSASSNVLLSILYELGGVCEAASLLDPAHHVWKTVMSWKSLNGGDANALNVTGFLGNLHLALVHATKQNAKSAKKFSKTAVTLATAGESNPDAPASAAATTARFVESVIAKM